jgi:hypothetical protein
MIIQSGLEEIHAEHIAEQEKTKAGVVLSGANTPYFENNSFFSEDSDHCPRSACFRALKLDRLMKKDVNDYLSHHTGRMWEDLVKKALIKSQFKNAYVEEHEHTREFDGGVRYVGHEDFKVECQGQTFLVETKTLQSGNTCEAIKEQEKLKLGALLQLIPALSSGNFPFGFISYANGSWFDVYSFATKKRLKFTPFRKTFYVTFDANGSVYVDENKTAWYKQGVDAGIEACAHMLLNDYMPPMPTFTDVNRKPMGYDVCQYCKYKEFGCKDYKQGDKLSVFADQMRSTMDVYV